MDSDKTKEFKIPFVGLKEGKHYYKFKVSNTFFSLFQYQDLENGEVSVELELEKKTNMLILNFALNGNIVLACDLCGEDFNQAIEANEIQLVKFSDENFEQEDDEITYLLPSDYKIDVSKYIFDFICLNIPMKRTHKLGNCDEETLENINTESENEQEIDPRWEKLKKLRNN